ncbi:Os07g0208900 [Oryza sativa Japonica Group]|uniref:Membrane transporter PFB0275w-like protein n=3 Tax=Oryza sativa TaxID=4530 RepID=Q6ZLK1_ORYSJ|nr:membrane transporter PFB0275w-like protein [Oryza sativa Japonica Group]BAF21078.2 Os07g0208900 [Oryza sativa Japonica Group]|eukprot:NP_001059164.2 Os07g0208900 [Oryza sativa Japonica Group]
MAGNDYWGLAGWRVAFIMVALVSLIIGILVYLYATDPRKIPGNHLLDDDDYERLHLASKDVLPPPSIWRDSLVATRSVMKVRTFQIIVLQGIIGSLPWTAIVFFTMWFELIGFDNNSSAALNSLFAIGCATGAFLGGVIADRLSRHFPDSARVMCAQFSAFMGIPFSWILLTVIPQSVDYWSAYAVTLFFMGITISWCATSANNPMFAEVVPPKHRTMIYAFDRAFEGSFASLAAPAVGLVTEKIYGYDSKTVNLANGSAEGAYALSRGLLTMMIVPFGVCVLFYSPLYLVFKRDRENAKLSSFKDQELV